MCTFWMRLPQNVPGEFADVEEKSSLLLWHRRLGHSNSQRMKILANEQGTGTVESKNKIPVSNCDTCAEAKNNQRNHPKVALVEVAHPLELLYADLPEPIRPASGAGISCVAKFPDHYMCLKSVYFLSK